MSERTALQRAARRGGRNPFARSSLRLRLIWTIALITGLSALLLGGFSYIRAQGTQAFLSAQLESAVKQQSEAQVLSAAQSTASRANDQLVSVGVVLVNEAAYLQDLFGQEDILGTGALWDARQQLTRLPNGQWDNPNSDPGAVLVSSRDALDDATIADLNTIAYLSLSAPGILHNNPSIVAIHFSSRDGIVAYYPNLDVANTLPGYDATKQPFYLIATADFDPGRQPVWTLPYQSPAMLGLIVTTSIPIYDKAGKFRGVLAADVELGSLAADVSNLQVGQTGYAILIDSSTHIIAMPDRGYQAYGLTPEAIQPGQVPSQILLGNGSLALQDITKQMVGQQTGVREVAIKGEDFYVAYAPIPKFGYSLAVFVPSAELSASITATRTELGNQTRQTVNLGLTIFGLVVSLAVLISWFIGRILTRPLTTLTSIAQRITEGDFRQRADVQSQDETGLLANAFNVMAEHIGELVTGLELRVTERTSELDRRSAQLEAAAFVARQAAAITDLGALLDEVARMVTDRFGYYHVGIFLVDESGQHVTLQAASSEGGQRMLQRGHQLEIGRQGIVGYAAYQKRPRIAFDVGSDAVYFNNPDLPFTRSEMALPLIVRDRLIGVLDIQSTETNAFTQNDIYALQTMADQVALAIENTRLLSEGQLIIRQLQAVTADVTHGSWRERLLEESKGFHYTPLGVTALTPDKAERVREGKAIEVPVVLRGQKIGTIILKRKGSNAVWTTRESELAADIATQVGLALENARLLEDSQRRAMREQTINEISAQFGRSLDVDTLLQTAVRQLQQLPDVSEVSVFLSPAGDGNHHEQ